MNQKIIFALGFFDGVHLGHQALLKACRELAEQNRCRTGAVTFTAHPDALVLGKAPVLINTIGNRVCLLKKFGMDRVVELPFDKEIMTTHWSDFLTQLVQAGAVGFVCGDDFRFGAGGLGTAKKLAAFCKSRNMPCTIVPEQIMDGDRISSTRIRGLLEAGDVAAANRLLGHPHFLSGIVTEGKQLGRKLGFSTANLPLPDGVLIPKFGVYATKVAVEGKTYPAVTNIGTRPTVNGQGVNAECHLLDFTGDLYGKEITVAFYDFLRPEQKFDSLDELKAQIAEDIAKTHTLLK
ncbi:MAG: bifunctional riboflavin kinase/FAD synthetase [Oscillospiraceae bacterium]|nr:bifunctional riboflavin kinase/FAD synthetase [Oscillospiraceae bacterium]